MWTLTHNSDFAKGFVGLLGHPEVIGGGHSYYFRRSVELDQIYAAIGQAAGVEPKVVHISTDFITAFSPSGTADGLIGSSGQQCF